MRRPNRRPAAALPLVALLAGCAIPQPPPSPDPIGGGARLEGGLGGADPAQAAFCVSQAVPLSLVVITSDGAAVRPASAARAAGDPDYALTLRRADSETRWVRQVAEAEPSLAEFTAYRLDSALSDCAPGLGDPPR